MFQCPLWASLSVNRPLVDGEKRTVEEYPRYIPVCLSVLDVFLIADSTSHRDTIKKHV